MRRVGSKQSKLSQLSSLWKSNQSIEVLQVRTLTSKEYEVISEIYNSTDEIEANLSFEFGIQKDTYYQLFHSYTEGKK